MGVHREVEDVVYRYAWAVDAGDIATVVGFFTEDGVFSTNRGDPPLRGVAAIAENFNAGVAAGIEAGLRTRHGMTNLVVEQLEQDRVHARSLLTLALISDGTTALQTGAYQDVLVLVDGLWRFSERFLSFDEVVA